ncbi:conjugal transfer protein TraF [Vibrio cyclitrophicus]|nr:conjugal transfer protein TraF [Vibrio cyclitrophicus]UPR34084.1 conjugal transfer protein TraF [Vibrio cyclitrophicus]
MGSTGAASASYLTSSFHNPALAARYKEGDNLGLILPVLGARVHDADDMIDKLDHFQDIDDNLHFDPDNEELLEEWRKALKQLDNGNLNVEANLGTVFAVPNKHMSTNFFIKSQVATIARFNVHDDDLQNDNPADSELLSSGQALGIAIVDVGFTFADTFTIQEHNFMFGISPKYQRIYGLNYVETLDDFADDFDIEEDYVEKSTFNIDFGTAYEWGDNTIIGLSAKNLLSQKLKTKTHMGQKATVLVEPEYVLGISYDKSWYNLTADIDLNAVKHFKEYDYKTQYAKVGAELDAFSWAQLRLGYMHSLTNYADDLATVGLGFKPFGIFGFDLAAQAGKDNNYGASAQLIMHF